ncbi:MAG: MFS transporter [Alphaproteobacteria bacterium]
MIKKLQLVFLDYISWLSLTGFASSSVIIGLCLPEISEELQFNSLKAGLMESFRNFALILVIFIFAIFAARFGKKIFSFSGHYLIALGLIIASFSQAYPMLFLGLIIIGLGGGAIEGLLTPLVVDLHPNNPQKYVNLINAFFPVGVVIAAILSGYFLHLGISWRMIFRLLAVYVFAIGVIFHLSSFPQSQDSKDFSLALVWQIFKQPIFWYLAIALFLAVGIEGSFTFWSRTYISEFLSDNVRLATSSLIIFSSFMALGRILGTKTSGVLAETKLLLLSAIPGILVALYVPFAHNLISFYIILAFSGFSIACFWPALLVLAAKFIKTNNTTLFGLLTLLGIPAFGIFPAIIGWLAQTYNLKIAFLLVPIAFIILIILIFVIQKYEKNSNSSA